MRPVDSSLECHYECVPSMSDGTVLATGSLKPGPMERTFICLVIIFFGTVTPKSSPDRRQIRLMQLVETVKQLRTCVNDTDPALLSTPENVELVSSLPFFPFFYLSFLPCLPSFLSFFFVSSLPPSSPPFFLFSLQETMALRIEMKMPVFLVFQKCPSCDSFKKKLHKEFFKNLESLLQKVSLFLVSLPFTHGD
ncbi:interleukin-21 [Antechinus flavipes]|uniref:interleukin-21 n=1 Tax=Antechinus flavipes TaxID=38775 RepID=UPI0022362365|nr:interleukin-21 [Antechinus flavipes]